MTTPTFTNEAAAQSYADTLADPGPCAYVSDGFGDGYWIVEEPSTDPEQWAADYYHETGAGWDSPESD